MPNTGLDLLYIFATFFHKINFLDLGDFVFLTQLDVKKLKTYKQAISCLYIQQWAYIIQKEIDQLEKNKM